MAERMSVTGFTIPGYDVPDAYDTPETSDQQSQAKPYKIPPVAWMIIFLVVGYFGLRMVLED